MCHWLRTLLIGFALVALVFSQASRAESINEQIVQFCKKHVGQSIERGECTDLANAALEAAKAKPHFRYKDSPDEKDYVWGRLLLIASGGATGASLSDDLEKIQPGDIVQFRNVRFEGAKTNGKGTYWSDATHHTAIVGAVNRRSRELTVYHQNWSGDRSVGEKTFKLKDMKQGWLRIYRPQQDPSPSAKQAK